jgi:hypothetical protein
VARRFWRRERRGEAAVTGGVRAVPRARRVLRRVASAVLAVVAGSAGLVGVSSQPAQANTFVYVSVALNISATFNSGGSNSAVLRAIEQAKRQIIAEIDASEARLRAHIDGSAAADVATCIRSSRQRLRGMDAPELQNDYGERVNQANYVSDCANMAGEFAAGAHAVATLQVADYLGYAEAEAQAIAMVMRAWAGLDLESQLSAYLDDYQRLNSRLRPSCVPRDFSNERWQEREWTCTAYNGQVARGVERRNHGSNEWQRWYSSSGEWSSGRVDLVKLEADATTSTSRSLIREALPALAQAWQMVRRDFVVAAVGDYVVPDGPDQVEFKFGQGRYWSEDGPLSWEGLSNPGSATAIASAIDVNDRRHYVAILDGQVHHRVRNRDESWTPWVPLPHAGAATAVTVAVQPDGQAQVAAVIGGQIHHRIRTSETAWTPWGFLGNPGTVTALGSAVFGGAFHLAAVIDGQVTKNIRQGNGSWNGWEQQLGHAGTATSVAAVADPQGQFQLAAVIDGQFYHRGWSNGSAGWTGWTAWATPGAAPGTATAVTGAADPAGNVQWVVAVRNRNGNGLSEVFLRTRNSNHSWSDEWVRMGIPTDTFLNISGIAAS